MIHLATAALLAACTQEPDLGDDAATPEAPPPPALAPAPCAPGSAVELRGLPFPDLQAAVDQAAPGDEVVICAGSTPVGEVTVTTDDFVVRGETGDPADVELTDGTLSFTAGASPRAALRGVTLGARLRVEVSTDAYFALGDVIIRDHDITEGYAVTLNTSLADVFRVRITNNQCDTALYIQRVSRTRARVRMSDILVDHNAAQTWLISVWGGEIGYGTLTVRRATFEDNETVSGFPLLIDGDGYRAFFQDATIRRNRLAGSAIEVYFEPGGSVVDRLDVTDNQTDAPVVYWHAPGAITTIQHARFLRNTSPYVGGFWPDPSALGSTYMTLRLSDVDFGAGADANTVDISGCSAPVGYVARGWISDLHPCP